MNFSGIDSTDGITPVNIDVTDLGNGHGPVHVNPIPGPGTAPYIVTKSAVDETAVAAHMPAGYSITYISVLCTLAAGAVAATVGDLAHLKGLVCIDAESTAFANTALNTGLAIPDSLVDGQQFIEIPLGVWTPIPLTAAMVNGNNGTGRLDFRSNSLVAAMALDFQVICS